MKISKQRLYKIVIAVLIIISLGMNIYLFDAVSRLNQNSSKDGTVVSNSKIETINYNIETDTTETIEKVNESVVGVAVYSNKQLTSSGSGVVYEVDGNTNYIITNHHVISDAKEIQVVFSNTESITAELVGSDQYSDIAVLKVTTDFETKAIEIGDSDLLKTGEPVLAIGSPLGIEFAGTVTQGIVSATNRTISVDLNSDSADDWDMNVIQTDAAINPGNSGGAFVNAAGELVGITSMKFTDTSVEGMGFALPINDVMKDVAEIRSSGKVSRPVIGISGVSLSNFSGYEKRYYQINTSLEDGIYVAKVQENGPAGKAGIKVGDIIVKLEDKEITTYKSFLTELYSKKPGDVVNIVINRDGKEEKIVVTLGQ